MSAFWVGLSCPSWEGDQREASLHPHQDASAALWGVPGLPPLLTWGSCLRPLRGSSQGSHCRCHRAPETSWQFSFSSFCMSHLSKSGLGAGAARLHSAQAHVAKEREGRPGGRRGERGDADGKGDGDRERFGRVRQYLHLILPTHTSLLPDIPDCLPYLTLTSHM